jgi:hypothetical protein
MCLLIVQCDAKPARVCASDSLEDPIGASSIHQTLIGNPISTSPVHQTLIGKSTGINSNSGVKGQMMLMNVLSDPDRFNRQNFFRDRSRITSPDSPIGLSGRFSNNFMSDEDPLHDLIKANAPTSPFRPQRPQRRTLPNIWSRIFNFQFLS